MLRGIFSAATGMRLQFDRIETYANNLANSQTNGFKRSEVVAESFENMVINMAEGKQAPLGMGVGMTHRAQDMTAGILRRTDNSMDMAIQGKGFFQIRKLNGELDVTRNGAMLINEKNELVTPQGSNLLDTRSNQPLRVTNRNFEKLEVRRDGTIYEWNNNGVGAMVERKVGQLKLVTVSPMEQAQRQFKPNGAVDWTFGANDDKPEIFQGFLEDSNVFVVNEMVNLTYAAKTYDTMQKNISSQDKMLDKVINEVGRIQ